MDENAPNQQEDSLSEPLPSKEPKRKKTGQNGVSALVPAIIWLTTIFFVGMVLGNFLWLLTADVLAFGREDKTVELTVADTDSLKEISKNLAQEGLVSYPGLFRLYAKLTDAGSRIRPGTYELSTRYDYHALIRALSSGTVRRDSEAPGLPS